MKKLLCLLICAPVLLSAQTDSNDKGIKWETGLNWEQIKAKAKADNKYIFVDCYATWCVPCKVMDKNVYSNDTVGNYFNEKFISVKVQFDSTNHDNEQVQKWRADARTINEEYKLQGFPSFLFFTPEGKLIHRALGYKDVNAFIKIADVATDPKSKEFFIQIENYKQGKKDYSIMPSLVTKTKELLGDQGLSKSIARDYKNNYLDKLTEEELCSRKNLEFIISNSYLVDNSNDRFFNLFYHQPTKVDSIVYSINNTKGYSAMKVNLIINKEEIDGKLWKDNKPVTKSPDWEMIKAAITKKYNSSYAENLVREAQLSFYMRIKDWQEFTKLFEKKIKQYPPKAGGKVYHPWGDGWGINGVVWDVFLYCNNKSILKKALKWSELSIQVEDNPGVIFQFYDTKANLLYKLGKVQEGISWEEKALEAFKTVAKNTEDPMAKNFIETIDKMKKGEPTWRVSKKKPDNK